MREIVTPLRVEYFQPSPDGWDAGQSTNTVFPASGKYAEARLLPDGRIAVAYSDPYTVGGQPYYLVFPSEQAYRDWANREPHVDPEGRGGRWFPSCYNRLKVREKHIPDEREYRGYRRERVCDCHECGREIAYSQARYMADGPTHTTEYFPFCPECYGRVSKESIA